MMQHFDSVRPGRRCLKGTDPAGARFAGLASTATRTGRSRDVPAQDEMHLFPRRIGGTIDEDAEGILRIILISTPSSNSEIGPRGRPSLAAADRWQRWVRRNDARGRAYTTPVQ